jgi:hypothetical protein
MKWKQVKQAREPSDHTWKQIDQTPIPLGSGRIWLADRDGNFTRALAWTWPILQRREPRKYRWWMSRADHASEPAPEAVAALKRLRQTAEGLDAAKTFARPLARRPVSGRDLPVSSGRARRRQRG